MDYRNTPTVTPVVPFLERQDAEALRKALKGGGTDKAPIIYIIAHRTNYQRQLIAQNYKQIFDRDLIEDLKHDLSGHFEDVMVALMTPMPLYLARELNRAMHGKTINKNTLVEVLCTRDRGSIENIKKAYNKEYGNDFTEVVKTATTGKLREFLIRLTTASRNEVTDDPQKAKNIAQQLYDAGEGRKGNFETEFIRVFTKESIPLLRQAFKEYKNIGQEDLSRVIDIEMAPDLKPIIKDAIASVTNPWAFLAGELRCSMVGVGTRDHKLVRLLVARAEIDLENIKQEYQTLYNTSLEKDIKGDTSGDYRKTLLALVDG
ncbi:unnamed protein product [Meganyctiphanes norvegica]|uniref:Annexin n=1 Tax=Meganyctiphanes norvegica TaxID=48144 RepID=A0AAV2RM90_MEGNR